MVICVMLSGSLLTALLASAAAFFCEGVFRFIRVSRSHGSSACSPPPPPPPRRTGAAVVAGVNGDKGETVMGLPWFTRLFCALLLMLLILLIAVCVCCAKLVVYAPPAVPAAEFIRLLRLLSEVLRELRPVDGRDSITLMPAVVAVSDTEDSVA